MYVFAAGQQGSNATASEASVVKAMNGTLQQLEQRVNARIDNVSAQLKYTNYTMLVYCAALGVYAVGLLIAFHMLMHLRHVMRTHGWI